MRQHLIVVLSLLVGASAAAEPKAAKPGAKPKPIDVKSVADKLEMFRDKDGGYYVSPKLGAFTDDQEQWVFYGDGKTMYQQRIVGYGADDKGYDWSVCPRA